MRWLIFPIGLVVCAGLGALGYVWFEVLALRSTAGEVSFGAIALGWALVWIWLLPRLPIHPAPLASDYGYSDHGYREDGMYDAPIVSARQSKSAARSKEIWEAKKARRIAELAADPSKAKYVEQAKAGDLISDLEIAYLEDPSMTVTCAHLRAVEAAMRAEGISLRPGVVDGVFRNTVNCACAVDMARLKQRFPLAECVVWEEIVEFVCEAAWVKCKVCQSSLSVGIPNPKKTTRVFPA